MLLVLSILILLTEPPQAKTLERQAIEVVMGLGGRVDYDLALPGRPVVYVALNLAGADGAGLKCLKSLPHLEKLDLMDIDGADAALIHVAELTRLRQLNVDRSTLTDRGMRHLLPLVNLETLTIGATAVGDEGLKSIASIPHAVNV